MSEVEKIYYNFDRLNEEFVDMPETLEASNKLEEVLGEEKAKEYEEYITSLAAANEKQGFIYGFNYAVALLTSGKAVG